MTSNIGARKLKDFGQGVGFGTSAKEDQADTHAKSVIENALKKTFAPEFRNRLDAVILFKTPRGEVKIKQTEDLTAAKGARRGVFWGLLAGIILGGPIAGGPGESPFAHVRVQESGRSGDQARRSSGR